MMAAKQCLLYIAHVLAAVRARARARASFISRPREGEGKLREELNKK